MTESTRGRLIVAEASMVEPTFARTVVFMIEHNEDGAIGVVVNRPTDTEVRDVVPAWGPYVSDPSTVFYGGPVSEDAALCVAERPAGTAAGLDLVWGSIGLLDLHMDPVDVPGGIERLRVFGGYAGWSPGQLDDELRRDGWYVVDATPNDIFCTDPESLWHDVLRRQRGPLRQYGFLPLDPGDN